MKFSDGLEIDESGPLRVIHEFDGWYVVGEGMIIPVKSEEEGIEEINSMQAKRDKK